MMADKVEISGYRKALKLIYYICGSFGFIAYFSYLLKLLFWPSNKIELVAAFLGIAVAGIPVFFRKRLEEKLPKKLFFVLESIFAYGMLFYTVSLAALSLYVFSASSFQADIADMGRDPVFIIYGAGVNDDRPGATLQKRLDKAYEYMIDLPESLCIVTGGRGADEIMPEAEIMKKYLMERGIDESRIYVEDKARNTTENIRYSYEIIEKEELSDRRCVSVSNAFHIPRISLILSRLDKEGEFVLGEDPNSFSMLSVMVREYMSYVKLLIFGVE